jgi:hypothetical protein
MSWDVSDEEFNAVLALPPDRRYDYFVKRVASHGEVWGLRSPEGWVVAEDAGQSYFPVWPNARFASATAVDAWADAEAKAIDVDDFTLAWTQKIEDDGMRVAVFPTPDTQGTGVSPARLRRDLEGELEQFGG